MITFEVASSEGDLGARSVTPGNVEKHRANFYAFLEAGVILTGVTATVTGTSSVTGAALSANCKAATWLFHAADDAEEVTLTLTVTTNDGQTLIYSILYSVG